MCAPQFVSFSPWLKTAWKRSSAPVLVRSSWIIFLEAQQKPSMAVKGYMYKECFCDCSSSSSVINKCFCNLNFQAKNAIAVCSTRKFLQQFSAANTKSNLIIDFAPVW